MEKKLFSELIAEWKRTDRPIDDEKIEYYVNELKVLLSDALLGRAVVKSEAQHLMLRETLEIAARHNLKNSDVKAFQRNYEQLKLYYFDQPIDNMQESKSMRELTGLYLLSLLAENRIGSFHCEIELLNPVWVENDPFISLPVHLERNLTEGNYERIFAASTKIPSEPYKVLMVAVLEMVRKEIALSLCNSCKIISLKNAAEWLFFKTPEDAMEFIQRMGWRLRPDRYINFARQKSQQELSGIAEQGGQLKFEEVRDTVLDYAKRIEQIV